MRAMGNETLNGSESRRSGSFGRTRSGGYLRRPSFNHSASLSSSHVDDDDDVESVSVAEAGDIGDRAIHSNRHSGSGRALSSAEDGVEYGGVVPISEGTMTHSHGFWSCNSTVSNAVSPVSLLPPAENTSPLSTDAIVPSEESHQETKTVLPWVMEYFSLFIHLAVFGILGVFTRYLLQKLFGPGGVRATSDQSYMYLDLPSNMVGSFLMGWLGVVFKKDIAKVSDPLAIGLTTGYLGSLTTFSGWNQKMLDLAVEGQWVFVVLGFVLGLLLAAISIIVGVETAWGFKWLLQQLSTKSEHDASSSETHCKVDTYKRHVAVMVVLLIMLGVLWGVSGTLLKREFSSGSSGAQLWLACLVGPIGVWLRWFLARINGQGIGRSGVLKWVPFGTLIANVSAACIMASLALTKKAVHTKNCNTVASGIQFGLLGCLSTVSTFIAEFNAMRESAHPWRAYAYATMTILTSFVLGIFIYAVPVWTNGYD